MGWFNGWINILFPYIREKWNVYLEPYSSDNGYVKEGREEKYYGVPPDGVPGTEFCRTRVPGPDIEDFPNGLSAAPVEWDYLGDTIQLKFKAGFVGAEQEKATGIVKPLVGWFVAFAG